MIHCLFFIIPLSLIMTPVWFWWSPMHIFFTYLVPVIPFFLAFDGLMSHARTRTHGEVLNLLRSEELAFDKKNALDLSQWTFHHGKRKIMWPWCHLYWFVAIKNNNVKA